MAGKQLNFDVLAVAKATGFDESAQKIDRMSAAANRTTKSFERQSKSTHLLSTALLSIGATAVPVAGVAAGALIGLGAAGAVALVGILGIVGAMKQGTALGKQYQAAFKPLVTEFGLLKQIAARGLFDGLNSGVKSLKPLFPVLNRDVALFSSQMGQVVGHAGPGLVALFTRLNPLFASIGDQLVHGSKGFEEWAKSSQSVGRFVAYVQTTLPQVEQTVGSLITTVSHLAIAAEPFGGTTLTAIRLFSSAINAIPIGVLQTVVPLLLGLKVGNTIANGLNNASVKISGLGKSAVGATGFVGKLGGVVGKLGPAGYLAGAALGGLSVVMGRSKSAVVEQTKRVNELVEAIQNGTAVVGAWNNAQETGAAAATKTGLSQKQIVTAITTTQAAYQGAQKHLDEYKRNEDAAALAGGRFGASSQEVARRTQEVAAEVSKLKNRLAESKNEYDQARTKVAEYAKQQGNTVLAAQIANDSYLKTAKSLGLTGDEYISASLAADKNAASVKTATAAMILQNDAAGLLNQTLQGFGGNNLGVAQAQTAVASATNAAAKALKDNKNFIVGNSTAALADQAALQGVASAALQHQQAVAQQTGSTVKATAALRADKAALEDSLRAHGRLTPAVQAYVDTLFKIKPTVRTKVDADTSTAYKKVSDIIGLGKLAAKTRRMIVGADTSSAYAKLAALNQFLQSMLHPVITPVVHGASAGQLNAGKLAIRDSGGPAVKGTPYLIGLNHKPEVFIPGESGHIAPIMSGGGLAAPASAPTAGPARVHVVGGRLELGFDAQGTLTAHIRDLILDEAEFAGTTGRMR